MPLWFRTSFPSRIQPLFTKLLFQPCTVLVYEPLVPAIYILGQKTSFRSHIQPWFMSLLYQPSAIFVDKPLATIVIIPLSRPFTSLVKNFPIPAIHNLGLYTSFQGHKQPWFINLLCNHTKFWLINPSQSYAMLVYYPAFPAMYILGLKTSYTSHIHPWFVNSLHQPYTIFKPPVPAIYIQPHTTLVYEPPIPAKYILGL